MKTINVVELFAGVGGFRLGLEGNSKFKVIWSNQWEPGTKVQHASEIYEERFGPKGHSNINIEDVPTTDIPNHNLLCGGFPCQDYSVASTLKNSKGLIGKKGVLWWSIHRILEEKSKKEPTQEEKTQLMIESILEAFDRYKEEPYLNPFGWVSYDFLTNLGCLSIPNEFKQEILEKAQEMTLVELKEKRVETKSREEKTKISALIENIIEDTSGKQDIVIRNCKNLGLMYYYDYILENNLSLSDEISKCIK